MAPDIAVAVRFKQTRQMDMTELLSTLHACSRRCSTGCRLLQQLRRPMFPRSSSPPLRSHSGHMRCREAQEVGL
jgi:hypothetical protein